MDNKRVEYFLYAFIVACELTFGSYVIYKWTFASQVVFAGICLLGFGIFGYIYLLKDAKEKKWNTKMNTSVIIHMFIILSVLIQFSFFLVLEFTPYNVLAGLIFIYFGIVYAVVSFLFIEQFKYKKSQKLILIASPIITIIAGVLLLVFYTPN